MLNILKAPSPKYLYTAAFNFFSWSRDTIPLIPPQKRPPVCEKKLGYRATPPIGYTAWHPIRQGAQPMRGQPVYGQNGPETESANSTPCPDAENHHHQASGIKILEFYLKSFILPSIYTLILFNSFWKHDKILNFNSKVLRQFLSKRQL